MDKIGHMGKYSWENSSCKRWLWACSQLNQGCPKAEASTLKGGINFKYNNDLNQGHLNMSFMKNIEMEKNVLMTDKEIY